MLGWFEGIPGSPGNSRQEGQEDQGEVKELGKTALVVFTLAVLRSPGPSGLPSGSSLGSQELPQASSKLVLLSLQAPPCCIEYP